MIKSKKLQFITFILIACICAPSLGADPNKAKTEFKFEIINEEDHLWRSDRGRRAIGPIKPTHMAVFYIRRPNYSEILSPRNEGISKILNTSAGKTFSEKQRNFVLASDAINRLGEQDTRNHDKIVLYGVSEEETKKLVRAFTESLMNLVKKDMLSFISERDDYEAKIAGTEKQLLEKETELKNGINRFEDVKKNVHYLSSEEAGKAIEKLNNTLDELNIEIAGMQVKLMVIDEQHIRAKENMKNFEQHEIYQNTIWPKLELMRIDQIIDLKVAEAKKRTAIKIRDTAEEYYNLQKQQNALPIVIEHLKKRMENHKKSLRNVEQHISQIESDMLPPKIYQNKVTIYPVR